MVTPRVSATFAARSISSHARSVSFRGRESRPQGTKAGPRDVARRARRHGNLLFVFKVIRPLAEGDGIVLKSLGCGGLATVLCVLSLLDASQLTALSWGLRVVGSILHLDPELGCEAARCRATRRHRIVSLSFFIFEQDDKKESFPEKAREKPFVPPCISCWLLLALSRWLLVHVSYGRKAPSEQVLVCGQCAP